MMISRRKSAFRRDYLMIEPAIYEIRIKGRLSTRVWSQWFETMTVVSEGRTTVIRGKVADQAALYGVLSRLRDLALPLLSVLRLELEDQDQAPEPTRE
jgi:hypothetical protein